MRTYLIYICIVLFAASCQPHPQPHESEKFRPQAGDLLFQINRNSAMTSAITAATATNSPFPFSHVAIALGPHRDMPNDMRGDSVIEATSAGGVRIVALSDFIHSSARIGEPPVPTASDSTGYGVVVLRLHDTTSLVHRATLRARTYLGQPYDYSYRPDNGRLYCSELVWESFRTTSDEHLFQARPMNFRDSTGALPPFWQQLFARLGEPVPEGVPGTNPADLAQDTLLYEVYRYFR